MYHVCPIFRDFRLWLILTPLFLVEILALQALQQHMALADSAQVQQVMGEVVEYRRVYNFNQAERFEIRFRFQVPSNTIWYTSNNGWGQHDLPVSIAQPIWLAAQHNQNRIRVHYLLRDPSINRPEGQFDPISTDLFVWSLLLLHNCYWFIELFLICRNYLRCTTAAEQQQIRIEKFWHALPQDTTML
jgi:hypothetical protein